MPIIIENHGFRYKNEKIKAIKNINITINDGEFVIITGPTGSGKSTLLKCLNGLIPHFYGGFYSGSITINGLNTIKNKVHELSREIGLVYQNSENQLVTFSVEKEIAFSLENLGFEREVIIKKVEEIINLLNLNKLRKRAPFELSGGEQQKTNIGAILALDSNILCFDEPTSNLDLRMTREFINFLYELNKKHRKTIIVVEHKLDSLLPIANRCILINKGEIIMDGKPIDVLSSDIAENLGIEIPKIILLIKELKKNKIKIPKIPKSTREFIQTMKSLVK